MFILPKHVASSSKAILFILGNTCHFFAYIIIIIIIIINIM